MADSPLSGIGEITTSATPNTWVDLPAIPCRRVAIYNLSGNQILIRQDSGGVSLPLNNGNAYPFAGITSVGQFAISCSVASQVIQYRWEL
jgi:hypothetical protein